MLSWKDIMDCKVHYGIIYNMFTTARDYGYKYFVWNGKIYKVIDELHYEDIGILAEDIK